MSAQDWVNPHQFANWRPETADYVGSAYTHQYVENGQMKFNDPGQANNAGRVEAQMASDPKWGERPATGGISQLLNSRPFIPNDTLTQRVFNSRGLASGLS